MSKKRKPSIKTHIEEKMPSAIIPGSSMMQSMDEEFDNYKYASS